MVDYFEDSFGISPEMRGADRSHPDLVAVLKAADCLALVGDSYAAKLIRDLVARFQDLESEVHHQLGSGYERSPLA